MESALRELREIGQPVQFPEDLLCVWERTAKERELVYPSAMQRNWS